LPDGVRVRVQQGAEISEQWIPAGWQVSVPVSTSEVQIAYGWKQIALPIALELVEFEVQRNEGSDSPAGFKSTVQVTDHEGRTSARRNQEGFDFLRDGTLFFGSVRFLRNAPAQAWQG